MSERSLTREDSTAPVTEDNLEAEFDADDEDMPQARMTRRHAFLFGLFVISAVAFLYFASPDRGPRDTWDRVNPATPAGWPWRVALECLALGGYIILFRTVFVRGDSQIDWRESHQITMAGLAATRLFEAAGAGASRSPPGPFAARGMAPRGSWPAGWSPSWSPLRRVHDRARDLRSGLCGRACSTAAGFAITSCRPSSAVRAIAIFLAISLCLGLRAPGRPLDARPPPPAAGPLGPAAGHRAGVDLTGRADGDRRSFSRGPVGALGAIAWWSFDIGVLWACFHASGQRPADSP